MTKREELAWETLSRMGTSRVTNTEIADDIAVAFAYVDAFLAACETETTEPGGASPEPDAVWTLRANTTTGGCWLGCDGMGEYLCDASMRNSANRLLAGRTRAWLRVYTEEIE